MQPQPGKLYLVPTPLGNLEDITHRSLRILAEVDLIAAEDTRRTIKLLNYFQIKNKLISYFQHNERQRTDLVLDKLEAGLNVALVSDAGMPGISDPGYILVEAAVKAGIVVVPIPGPCALVAALAASGLDTASFWFEGFLPRKTADQVAKLREMKEFTGTIIFYESPHRLKASLKNIYQVLGDRQVVLARELTKIHEEFVRGKISFILEHSESLELKGEFTVLVSGQVKNVKSKQNSTPLSLNFIEAVEFKEGTLKEKIKAVAEENGLSNKEAYQRYIQEKNKRRSSSS